MDRDKDGYINACDLAPYVSKMAGVSRPMPNRRQQTMEGFQDLEYRGCSYYTGINTSGTNSKSTKNANSSTRSLIRNQDQIGKNGVGLNS